MSTKAELFRYLQERSGPKRAPARREARSRDPAGAREEARSRAGRKAPYALEPSSGRPSRKSTRRSSNRQKNDVQFRMKRRVGEARAQDRAATRAPR